MLQYFKKFFLHKNILHSYNVLRNIEPQKKHILDSNLMFFYLFLSTSLAFANYILHHTNKNVPIFIFILIFNISLLISYIFSEYIRDAFLFVKHTLIKRKFEKIFIHDPAMTKALMDYIEFKKLNQSSQNIIIDDLSKESFSFDSIYIIHTNYYKVQSSNIKQTLLEDSPINEDTKDKLSSTLKFFSKNSTQ